MSKRFNLDDHARETQIFNRRMLVAAIIILLLFSGLIVWLVNLQVNRYEYFAARSDGNRLHSQYVPPNRGLIYDRNGVLLAENRPIFNLTVVRETAQDLDKSLELLRSIISLTDEDIEQYRLRQSRRPVPNTSVPLRYKLSQEEIAYIAVNQHLLPGIAIEAQLVRYYPLQASAAHTIGYVSEINREELAVMDEETSRNYRGTQQIGKTGIEKTYEYFLHGQVGHETVEKNNRGQVTRVLDRTDPIPGQAIMLHLDADLQLAAERALGDFRGAIVAIDPATGGVLAMISKPDYDPNMFVTGIGRDQLRALNSSGHSPLFNRAASSRVPGSTIKPFIGLAGLYYGVVTPDTVIDDRGFYALPGRSRPYYDWTWWRDKTGHGAISLERAIYQSCNTYFHHVAVELGIDRIHDYLRGFGFGANMSLDIPEASNGIVPSRAWKRENRGEAWYAGETPFEGIGNGIFQATTLQMASAAATLANHGVFKAPRLLRGVEKAEGGFVDVSFDEEEIAQPMLPSPAHVELVRQAMVHTTSKPRDRNFRRLDGTAYDFIQRRKPLDYPMAGKSGTAQIVQFQIDASGTRTNNDLEERFRDHAMFIAFEASQNSRIAVAVFLENGGGGSSTAGPVAREVMDAYLLPKLYQDGLMEISAAP
jgi:penicillin-binding protein 2